MTVAQEQIPAAWNDVFYHAGACVHFRSHGTKLINHKSKPWVGDSSEAGDSRAGHVEMHLTFGVGRG